MAIFVAYGVHKVPDERYEELCQICFFSSALHAVGVICICDGESFGQGTCVVVARRAVGDLFHEQVRTADLHGLGICVSDPSDVTLVLELGQGLHDILGSLDPACIGEYGLYVLLGHVPESLGGLIRCEAHEDLPVGDVPDGGKCLRCSFGLYDDGVLVLFQISGECLDLVPCALERSDERGCVGNEVLVTDDDCGLLTVLQGTQFLLEDLFDDL